MLHFNKSVGSYRQLVTTMLDSTDLDTPLCLMENESRLQESIFSIEPYNESKTRKGLHWNKRRTNLEGLKIPLSCLAQFFFFFYQMANKLLTNCLRGVGDLWTMFLFVLLGNVSCYHFKLVYRVMCFMMTSLYYVGLLLTSPDPHPPQAGPSYPTNGH